jgi:hypothetical protein
VAKGSFGSEPAEGYRFANRYGLSMQHRLAQYYLNVYRLRLVMVKNGVTRPSGAGLEFYRRFVTALERIDRNEPVELEIHDGVASFTTASFGTLLAEIRFSDDPSVLVGSRSEHLKAVAPQLIADATLRAPTELPGAASSSVLRRMNLRSRSAYRRRLWIG